MANKNAKIVRGAGSIKLLDVLHLVKRVKNIPVSYMGSDGEVVKEPDYSKTYESENGNKIRVQYQVHERTGMNGFFDEWKKYLDRRWNNPKSVAIQIELLRNTEFLQMTSLAISFGKAMITTTTRNPYKDLQVKMYHYNGDDTPTVYPVGHDKEGLWNYGQVRMGYMKSWKTTFKIDANEARELQTWLRDNKTVIDLFEAQANMGVAKERHTYLLEDMKRNTSRHTATLQAYEDYLEVFDTEAKQWDVICLWANQAPRTLSGADFERASAMVRREYGESPSVKLHRLKDRWDNDRKRLAKNKKDVEAYEMMGWGEEE